MQRTPEPELMDGEAQAAAYAHADFSEPNAAFVEHVRRCAPGMPPRARVVDLGCGPADIAVRLARRHPGWTIDAVDGSPAMLRHARAAVAGAGLADRVRTVLGRIPEVALPPCTFDLVVSNSLLHHLPDPDVLWTACRRLLRPGGRLVVMDLFRPDSAATARAIVDAAAADEDPILREDFYNSLLAAFTPGEVRGQLEAAGLSGCAVDVVSERHLLVHGAVA